MLTKEIFLTTYPNADVGVFKFTPTQVYFLYQRKEWPVFKDLIGGARHHYSGALKYELDLALFAKSATSRKEVEEELKKKSRVHKEVSGFPYQYKYNSKAKYKFIPLHENPSRGNYNSFDIYITPKDKTHFTFRNIFKNSLMKFDNSKDAKEYLKGKNLKYWSQQLNFAMWCATGGCGVTRDMLKDDQVGSFYKFHVYFTIRRILKELQCPLPGYVSSDGKLGFKEFDNFYSRIKFEKLKVEFNTPSDFRLGGENPNSLDSRIFNKGLGDAYKNGVKLPGEVWPLSYKETYRKGFLKSHTLTFHNYLPDEKDSTKEIAGKNWVRKYGEDHVIHNLRIDYLKDDRTAYQYEWFFPESSWGLTKAGLGRINQSTEAFVYCVLGAQVNTTKSIIGGGGGAKETKLDFLNLFESMAAENEIKKSLDNYKKSSEGCETKT